MAPPCSPRIPHLFVLLAAALTACATASGPPAGPRDFLSPEEIQAVQVSNAYELVERLRPLWLRSRGGRSTRLETEIVVYVNGSMVGGVDALRSIPIEIVGSMRALDAAEAGHLPGLGSRHVERAILVELRSGILPAP